MLAAPFPERESDRIAALKALGALDGAPDRELDTLVDIASAICGTPISLISFIDSDRQWFKASRGLPNITETARDNAFCAHTILGDDVLEVRDARTDERFHDNPFVVGAPAIRFYAGVPLRLATGLNVGSLCVIGREPGELSDLQRRVLRNLAGIATRLLEGRQALTELRRINQSLDASRRRFKALAESSPVGIYRIDANLNRTFVNRSWLDIWDRGREEILGAGWRRYIHPDDLAAAETEFRQAVSDKCDIDNRYRIIRPDGSIRHVRSKARPLLNDDDEIIDFVGTLEDVTDQVVAQELHAAREEVLRRIYEATPVMMYSNDPEHRIVAVSDLWLEKLGYRREEVIGRQTVDFMSPASVDHVKKLTRPSFATTGMVKNVELEMITKSGETIDVLLSAILDDRNKADPRPQTLAVMEDVTERHRAEKALQDALDRMQIATDSGGIGIWDWDLATGHLLWDNWTRRIYGMPPSTEPITFQTFFRYVHPEDGPIVTEAVRLAISDGRPLDIEFRIIWGDGSLRHVKATARVRRNDAGAALRLIGANIDVTEQRSLSSALAAQHELLRVTLNSIGDAVISTDKSGDIVWLNPVAERMTGWSAQEALGRPLGQIFTILSEETRSPYPDPVAMCLATGHVTGLANNTVLVARDGTEYGIEDSAAPIRDSDGDLLGVVLVFHDVTEQRRLSSEMSYRASHDALTGLVNRVEFEARLRRALRRAHEEACEHSLVYLDLDQFKIVNDTCGHAIGDVLLQQVAKLFRDTVRESDTVGRLGGDEFAIILEFCAPDRAQRIAQGICDRMNEFRFVHDGRRFRIGTSIGVVPVDGRWSTIAAILQAADSACYAAKEGGRNRVHVWHDSDAVIRSRLDEMQWTTLIEQALDDDGFVLYAQRIEPIVPARQDPSPEMVMNAEPVGSEGILAEVLVRMNHPNGTVVSPGQFLAAAERFHLVSRLDRWVVTAAINWMRSVPLLADIQMLSVNLSGQTIGDRACHRWILDQVTAAGPDVAHRLCFEITETAVITNMVDAVLLIEQLRSVGVRVALDDFGAGASSFGYLKRLKVDTLKIDGQFIENVDTDALDDAAVRCFADVARVTNMKTVAEGVETTATLKRLAEIGIDYAQGFLLNHPKPIDELLS